MKAGSVMAYIAHGLLHQCFLGAFPVPEPKLTGKIQSVVKVITHGVMVCILQAKDPPRINFIRSALSSHSK